MSQYHIPTGLKYYTMKYYTNAMQLPLRVFIHVREREAIQKGIASDRPLVLTLFIDKLGVTSKVPVNSLSLED